jgi:thiamine biosynthesis lipoprotein
MGTAVSFDIRGVQDQTSATSALDRAVRWLHHVDETFSTFKSDSELMRVQRGDIRRDCWSVEMSEVIELAADVEEQTHGAYQLRWRPDGAPDPTGVVKGWAADRASLILTAGGARAHAVNAAGDVRLAGRPGPHRVWSTGIAHPHRAGVLVAVVDGTDIGIASSGSAEQGRHIVDSRSGLPAAGVASATVVGPSLARADGYATAAVSRGADARELLERLDEAGWPSLLVTDNGEVWASAGFPGQVYPDGIPPESA